MIRFGFGLYPLEEVSPWGGGQPRLHWFGLAEGWYWTEAGGHQLLRRTRVDHRHPYVDYYLARLWEDVNVLTPAVLGPVPTDLEPFIASDSVGWECDPVSFIADGDVDMAAPDHPVVTASSWHGGHGLDFGYLRNAPRLRFWRTVRDGITGDWRHEDDGQIGFIAGPAVRFSVPTAAYLEAVRTLDRELLARPGIGPVCAAQLLATAGDNPDRLANEAAFAALCGVNPVEHSSGKTQRHRLNRGGDRAANSALWTIATSSTTHAPASTPPAAPPPGAAAKRSFACSSATSSARSSPRSATPSLHQDPSQRNLDIGASTR